MKKILVISHDACYGAPRLLLDICGELKKRGWTLSFVLLSGGPLQAEFEKMGDTALYPSVKKAPSRGIKSAWGYAKNFLAPKRVFLDRLIKTWRPDLIYMNSTASLPVLDAFARVRVPIIIHVHELEETNLRLCTNFVDDFRALPACYFVVSKRVQSHLKKDYLIPTEKITLTYPGINTHRIDSRLSQDASQSKLEGLENCDFIVGAAGWCSWRKGTDLWLQMARYVRDKMNSSGHRVKFVWCGGLIPSLDSKSDYIRHLAWDVKKLGLEKDVLFTGYLTNPYPLYRKFDVFTLPSREDPCPLVCLENMYLGKPIVCFLEGGGIPEVVREDAGVIVPKMDIAQMAEAVSHLLLEKKKSSAMGNVGKNRVLKEHRIKITTEKIEGILNNLKP